MQTKDIKIRVNEKTHKAFKVKLAKDSLTAQAVLEAAINGYLLDKHPA